MPVLTGLVYAAVVILWAAVLVPQWLRRHDRNAATRTTLTFHRAMKALGRRRVMPGASRASHNVDVVVSGAQSRVHDRVRVGARGANGVDPIDEHLDSGIDPFEGGEQERHLIEARLARSRMIAREAAARRRRHVRQTLIGLGVIALVLYVMGAVPLVAVLLPPLGLGALWFATRQIGARPAASRNRASTARPSSARSAKSRRRTASARTRTKSTTESASRSRTSSRSARRYVEPGRAGVATAAGGEELSDVRLLSDDEVAARQAATDPDAWDAVESPLPRYIAESGAPRRRAAGGIRGEDWTARRMLEQVEALRTPGSDAEAELGLDDFVAVPGEEAYEHRRAVND